MLDESLLNSPPARLVSDIAARERTCLEVMEAFLQRIERVNPAVNAICTLDDPGAREQAVAMDAALAEGQTPGALCGLPNARCVGTQGFMQQIRSQTFNCVRGSG